MTDSATAVLLKASSVSRAGARLRSASVEERARWLLESANALALDAATAQAELAGSTGLSGPMVDWAVNTTLATIERRSLLDLAAAAHASSEQVLEPLGMLSVVLAGNVFTAPVRAIVVPLLLGVPVLVKASSRGGQLPDMILSALRRIDPELGQAMDVVEFRGGDLDCEAALIAQSDAVSVYGSDETVDSLRARLGPTPMIAHGHGVSAMYCGARALRSSEIDETLAAIALDISAYDQRGCLSPQLVFIEAPSPGSLRALAERLARRALEPLCEVLPRGPLPIEVGAVQAQWRGLAEIEGELVRGSGFSIAIRSATPIRWSPGYRNVTLAPVDGTRAAVRAMTPIGANLKCVGSDQASIAELRDRLSETPSLDAYVCPIGTMQTPALDAPADGRPIWHGLLREKLDL